MTENDLSRTPLALSGIEPVSILDEMRRSYLDYAMSVIVSRALPDARDGLKPVHRRILYAAHEGGYHTNRKYVKSARPVADVMGKYHPHGDASIYDALVRMAQSWSMRAPLIDGQGNFGSIDGDPPAAMRYTEARLARIAHELLEDINSDTVDFQDSYDSSNREPRVLPARFPNLLVNGSAGIAVGMATNIPPHNLGEVCNAAVALIDNPDLPLSELLSIIPGPDFPTGALILGHSGIHDAFATGRGSIRIRGKTHIEQISGDREAIIVTEMPYQVNKASMIEKIADLVRNKRIEGISDIRDESDRQGYRVVIELKRNIVADVILNQLYSYTPLQTFFGVNAVALNGGKPELMNLVGMLKAFLSFREEVIIRRTRFLLRKARDRAHILLGLAVAVANLDEIVRLIRHAPDPQTARQELMARFWPAVDTQALIALVDDPRHILTEDGTCRLSEEQARAILDLKLQRLTGLGREEIDRELNVAGSEIRHCLEILGSAEKISSIVREGLIAVRNEFATPRLTEILDHSRDMDDESLIQKEDMVVTVTHEGYIKRVPLSLYRSQNRGGKGRSGMSTRDSDFVTRLFVANTHTAVLFFSSRGLVYKEKVWRLPIASPQSRGKALINLLPVDLGDRISAILPLPDDSSLWEALDVMFSTTKGTVRRNRLSDFSQVNRAGKIAMKLEGEGDAILAVEICSPDQDVLLVADSGQCIRFPVSDVRVFRGRDSQGVRGIRLEPEDRAISMAILTHMDVTPSDRYAYLKRSSSLRRLPDEDELNPVSLDEGDEVNVNAVCMSDDLYKQLESREQFVLTISEFGYGKRSSSYDFRLTARGGKGIRATDISKTLEIGKLVAAFPVENDDQIMLVSNKGQIIRVPVSGIRIAGRSRKGVTIFNTALEEKVVSVERIPEAGADSREQDECFVDSLSESDSVKESDHLN